MSEYKCKSCNKLYKHKQSLYRHKKNCKIIVKWCDDNQNNDEVYYAKHFDKSNLSHHKADHKPNLSHNDYNVNNSNPLDGFYYCKYCNRKYKHYQSRYKHQKVCKLKDGEMVPKDKMEEKLEDIKNDIFNFMNRNFKVHHKTFEKMKRQLKEQQNINNSNNSINNSNNTNTNSNNTNNTMNNTLNNNCVVNNNTIIALGKEDFRNVLTKQQQIDIVNKGTDCLKYFLNITHLNPKTPQYRSFFNY